MTTPAQKAIRATQVGLFANAVLVAIKLVAGIIGNSYALVADAVESAGDILSSIIVWGGIALASQPADDDHPFGHGKAEALSAAVVSLMLLGAALGIAAEAVHQIRTPHPVPSPWTLYVLAGVMAVKWSLARRVRRVGSSLSSTAVDADAAHHLADAITSAAAFVGISIAVIGSRWSGRPGWEAADDWAALFASLVIAFNGVSMMRVSFHDLMDRMAGADVVGPVRSAAMGVPGVLAIEKLHLRKAGMGYRATIHVHADPSMSLFEAHALGGRVKRAICAQSPHVDYVLVHMEPFDPKAF